MKVVDLKKQYYQHSPTPAQNGMARMRHTPATMPYELVHQIFLKCTDVRTASRLAMTCRYIYGVWKEVGPKVVAKRLPEHWTFVKDIDKRSTFNMAMEYHVAQ
jgi:hypothetical protein